MSKRLCRKEDGLDRKMGDRKKKFYCKKCDRQSPKEKWCCKPAKIER